MRTIRASGRQAAETPFPASKLANRVAGEASGARKQPARHGEFSKFQTGMFGCHRQPIGMFGTMQGYEQ